MLKEITNNFTKEEDIIEIDENKYITSNIIDVLKRYYKEVTLLDKENVKIMYKEKR